MSVSAAALENMDVVIDLTDAALAAPSESSLSTLGHDLESSTLDELRHRGAAIARHAGKRMIDVVVASLLLVLLAPVMLIAMIAVKLGDPGPIFFRQSRVGLDGRTFTMCKLRSMVADAEARIIDLRDSSFADGLLFKVEDDPRVTKVGRWLRRTCIDEVPQLWNVLRGEMSLVGPRPLPVRPDEFSIRDGARHVVKPGLTGPWQVLGGPEIPYREMIDLDLGYVSSWTLGRDLGLLVRTVPAVLRRGHC